MNPTKLLLTIGLVFNTLGAIVLLLPQLNPWKHISNELIVGEKKEEEKYIQGKDLQNMVAGIIGFILLGVGFILQLIGTLVA